MNQLNWMADVVFRPKQSKLRTVLLGAAAMAGLAGTAWAADPPPKGSGASAPDMSNVVVTARKRSERLLDIPISMTSISQQSIQEKGVVDIRDIPALAPGITFLPAAGNASVGRSDGNIYFRGMSQTGAGPRGETGSLFVDGIYIEGDISSVQTNDIDHIEVINGPQSAYFGRNTFGGAVNFITKAPKNTFAASFSGEDSSLSNSRFSGEIEGPLITDMLDGRLSTTFYDKAAVYHATDGGGLGAESSKSVVGDLLFKPITNLSIRGRFQYQHDDDGPPDLTTLRADVYGTKCPGQTFSGQNANGVQQSYSFAIPYFCGQIPNMSQLGSGVVTQNTSLTPPLLATLGIPNQLVNILNLKNIPDLLANPLFDQKTARLVPKLNHYGLVRDIYRGSVQLNYTFLNGYNFDSFVAYNDSRQNELVDADHSDAQNAFYVTPVIYRDLAVEARISSPTDGWIHWLVGVNEDTLIYHIEQFGYHNRSFDTSPNTTADFLQAGQGEDANVAAVFGSIDWNIWRGLTVSGEGRYQVDTSRVNPEAPTALTATFHTFLPRAIIKYQFTPNLQVYANYARGVLPGTYNAIFTAATPYQQAQIQAQYPNVTGLLQSQTLDSYEIGLKQSLFQGKLQYTLDGYSMTWNNLVSGGVIQTPTSATNPAPIVFTGINIPSNADLWGIEFQADAQPIEHLRMHFNWDWADSKFTKIYDSTISNLTTGVIQFDGNKMPKAPEFSWNISANYSRPLVGQWDWFAGGGVNYVGKAYESDLNTAYFSAYYRVNMQAGVQSGQYTVEIYAKNLLNDTNWDSGFRSTSNAEPNSYFGTSNLQQGLIVLAPNPREVGLRVSARF